MMKISNLIGILVFSCSLLSCGNSHEVTVSGKDSSGSGHENDLNKPVTGIPPQFSPDQLQESNYVEWTVSSGSTKYCLKWTIQKIYTKDLLAQIKVNRSPDCANYNDGRFEFFIFSLEDGLVLRHKQVIQGIEEDVPAQDSLVQKKFNVFQVFYKNPEKVQFSIGSEILKDKIKFAVFKITKNDTIYYKGDDLSPKHPWHGLILKMKSHDQSPSILTYHSSKPDLIGIN